MLKKLIQVSIAVLVFTLSVSACSTGDIAQQEWTYQSASVLPGDPAAQLGWRLIGRKRIGLENAACPAIAGWKQKHLFGDLFGDLTGAQWWKIIPVFRPYCEYRPRSMPVNAAMLAAALGSGSNVLHRIDPDALAVKLAGSGELLEKLTWQEFEAQARAEANGFSDLGKAPAQMAHLVIGDTAPDMFYATRPELARPNVSGHGHALVTWAKELACKDPGDLSTCMAWVSSALFQKYTSFDKWDENGSKSDAAGGKAGTIADVGYDLTRVVQLHMNKTPKLPLVVNLSLGWSPAFSGQESHLDMSGPAQATYAAFQYAACHDVLVIAAAGNASPSEPAGPWFPGAWFDRSAPSLKECYALLSKRPTKPIATMSVPLVYAVGGVTKYDSRLANSAPGAEPPLVAYADHVQLASKSGIADLTDVITGTSASALLVSTTAASTWSYNPSWRRDQVMANIYDVAATLRTSPRTAEFWFRAGSRLPPKVRRVNSCDVINSLAPGAGLRCYASTAFAGIDEASLGDGGSTGTELAPGALTAIYDRFSPLEIKPWVTVNMPVDAGCKSCSGYGGYVFKARGSFDPSRTVKLTSANRLYIDYQDVPENVVQVYLQVGFGGPILPLDAVGKNAVVSRTPVPFQPGQALQLIFNLEDPAGNLSSTTSPLYVF